MNTLWAPWRMGYLQGDTNTPLGCIFCRAVETDHDEDQLVLHRSEKAIIMLNRYPYSNGHMMIVPVQHLASLEDLDSETMKDITDMTQVALRTLRTAYAPEGFNVGVNIGKAAGAGVPDHVHVHVLPRWQGDTNFMTSIAETRVVPETLPVTLNRLRDIISETLHSR